MAVNQGSRAGLITSVVILSIVSVVAVIFAFWFGAEKRKTEQDLADLRKKFTNVVSDAALSGTEMKELENLRSDPNSGIPGLSGQTKLFDVVAAQRDQLIKVVTGKDAGPENTASIAIKNAGTVLSSAGDQVKAAKTQVPSTDNNLIGAVDVLANKVKAQAQTIAQRDSELDQATARAKQAITQAEDQLKTRDDQIAKIRAESESSISAASAVSTKQESTITDIRKQYEEEGYRKAEAMAQKDVELVAKSNEVKRLEDRLKATQSRFDRIRVGVTDPILRHEDGVITGFSGKDIVYINLGAGKQVIPGMTFEVYDKGRGIPKIDDPLSEEQPAGKASIEVLHVMDDTSECRVTRQSMGQQIMQGDPILNVVYDPSVKYSFYVHGNFDLDGNGVATAQDADVVRRIVTQWGGNVTPKLTVETDFVVLGAEPVVPQLSDEERNDPIRVAAQKRAEQQLADYQNILKEAREMHIPILNQNRFLYFTGQEAVVKR